MASLKTKNASIGKTIGSSGDAGRYGQYANERHTPRRVAGLHLFTGLLRYVLAIAVALLACIVVALISGAIVGYTADGIVNLGVSVAEGLSKQIVSDDLRRGFEHAAMTVTICVVVFIAAPTFCVVALKLFPLKHTIQSTVLLESVAVFFFFVIAGDAAGSEAYAQLFVGLSGVLAIACLGLRRPNWVYLTGTPRIDASRV